MAAASAMIPAQTLPTTRTARSGRLRAMLFVGMANLALACIIGRSYLEFLPPDPAPKLWVFAHAGLLSSLVTLTLLPGLGLGLAAVSKLSDRSFLIVQTIGWSLFQLTLFVDTRVFGLYHYHLNGAAWNLLTTRGSQDSFHLGPRIWALGTGMFLLFALGNWFLWKLAWLRIARTSERGALRGAFLWILVLTLSIGVEKTIYAGADLSRDRQVVALSQMFPVYPRLSVSEMLPRDRTPGAPQDPRVAVRFEGARLAYPHEAPQLPVGRARPNVLILVVDSWRADMLEASVTPRMEEYAATSRRFADHLSGGNATRFGLFALLYGLHGSYWWPVLEEQRSPALLDALLAAGYQARVFSSASMEFPELRRTAWSRIQADVEDRFPSPRRAERDRLLGERFTQWLGEAQSDGRPFFAFALLDSAHQTYDFPSHSAPFQPYAQELDYLEMASSQSSALREEVRNRYRNALHHADSIAGEMLDAMKERGLLDDTLVLVTGDHGEEFAERGHWGHTSNFAPEQVRVPLFLRGPGVAAGIETAATSHLDVPATLLELLGVPPDLRAGYTLGGNLLEPQAQRARAVAGWGELGLWTSDGIFRVPLAGDTPLQLAAYGEDWQLLPDQDRVIARQSAALEALSRECARFLDLRHGALAWRTD